MSLSAISNNQVEDADPQTQVFKMLTETILFKDANSEVLQSISECLIEQKYRAGDPIFMENEKSHQIFFVKSGSVEIVKYDAKIGQLNRIVVLNRGEHFSEFSVLTQSNHTTSAFALEPTVLQCLDEKMFLDVFKRHPQIGQSMVDILARLNQQITHSADYLEYFKENLARLDERIPQIFPHDFIAKYSVVPVRTDFNTLAIAMRDPSNPEFFKRFRAIHPHLHLKVFLINETDFKALQKRLVPVYAGLADTSGQPRVAMPAAPPSEPPPIEELLRYTTYFSQLPPFIMDQLIPLFKVREFKDGEFVFEERTASESLFVIQSGSIQLSKALSEGGVAQIAKLGQYDSFGETSLITDSMHSLNAKAVGPVVIYALEKRYFKKLLEHPDFFLPLAQVLARRLQASNQSNGVRFYTGPVPAQLADLAPIIPRSVLSQHKILAIKLEETKLTIGLVNPEDEAIYPVIKRYLGDFRIEMMAIKEVDFQAWFATLEHSTGPTGVQPKGLHLSIVKSSVDPLAIFGDLIAHSIECRASDVHFEPQADGLIIRFRVDGRLRESGEKLSIEAGRELVNRIKVASQLDISESRHPQDGQLRLDAAIGKGVIVSARVSTVATAHGEKVVIRLNRAKPTVIPLDHLASDRRTVLQLKEIVAAEDGLFLVAGPTGAGKTSSLYSVLAELNRADCNIVTVEDPIEVNIPGINQIPINEAIGITFDSMLRHVLRQDPDIIMIGEIRDRLSAQISLEAALTGHFVLASIHANNSLEVIPRLRELGVTAGLIYNGIAGVMAQRLVRAICPHCKTTRTPLETEVVALSKVLGMEKPPLTLSYGKGCVKCDYIGFYGRIGVFEVWRKTPRLTDLLISDAKPEQIREELRASGFRTMAEFGLTLALSGMTTVAEVLRSCPTER